MPEILGTFFVALAVMLGLAIVGCLIEKTWLWLRVPNGPSPAELMDDGYYNEMQDNDCQPGELQ